MPRKPKSIQPDATIYATGDAVLADYRYDVPAPDPVSTIGTWPVEAITIRRRDDNQVMLFQHVVDWLHTNPDAEISSIEVGQWERGREVTIYAWRKERTNAG